MPVAEEFMRVAIIGSGPAGFYAAEALLKRSDTVVHVDMFDRLPTPFGLVRGGVAPDHPRVKSITRAYEQTAARPTFRFLGNVCLGRDLSVDQLRRHYHQIVYAVGNEASRRLGIPGEGITRCTPAAVFVGWYNGHPDYRDAKIDLSVSRVAVVGNGNVAVDVARVLLKAPDELGKTDIAGHALAALGNSRVREVFILGRRGPEQATFTPKEVAELGEIDGVDLVVDPSELADCPAFESLDNRQQQNLEILRSFAARPAGTNTKKVHLRFFVSAREVVADAAGTVAAIALEQESHAAAADGTGKIERLDVGMVLPAIGYAAKRIEGVPFDETALIVANEDGRVVDPRSRTVIANEYVVGWARTGPRGLIGAHKGASAHVVEHMTADGAGLETRALPEPDALMSLLRQRGQQIVSFDDWKQLDDVEQARGERRGAPRDKIVDVGAMLGILGST